MNRRDTENNYYTEKYANFGKQFTTNRWPKIILSERVKKDILKVFNIFSKPGEGTISIDDVRVAFRALGYDAKLDEFEELRERTQEFDYQVNFGEFLKLMEDKMLAVDNDMDIEKSFELLDTGNKGFIDLNDLRLAINKLNYQDRFRDEDLMAMLLGGQMTDPTKGLSKEYEERQKLARIRSKQKQPTIMTSGGLHNTALNPAVQNEDSGLPGFTRARRLSSSGQLSPEKMVINLQQFKHLMKMTRPPAEDITLM
uniref:EF-hand domain-containing protein n=1 Tax=Trichobilharzia regenti TaxID=157069 RepID=A0AA85JNH3_TRIRE|nr:unnamed protein product [Trichobilharzia regenti]